DQNIRMPILEAIDTVHSYGIEIHGGIVLGFDSEQPDSEEKILEFIDKSNIPIVALNVLYALPRTPLWRRLEREGRLIPNAEVEDSNIMFHGGQQPVIDRWRRIAENIFTPKAVYKRYRHNVVHTY